MYCILLLLFHYCAMTDLYSRASDSTGVSELCRVYGRTLRVNTSALFCIPDKKRSLSVAHNQSEQTMPFSAVNRLYHGEMDVIQWT